MPSSASQISLINDNGTFYLIIDNQRQGITSPSLLYSYGLEFKDATPATSADLSLSLGPLLLPADGSLVKSLKDQTSYLISNSQRYGFVSSSVFTALGFKFSSVLTITDPELQALPLSAVLISDPASAHLPGVDINFQGTIYKIGLDNQRHPYPSLSVYNSWHRDNNFSSVVRANAADLSLTVGEAIASRAVR